MEELDMTSEHKRFEKHLEIKDNNQIILSGIFGIGKTHFIKNHFTLNDKKYEYFHLTPVNYAVSQNEDIIDLIKYDLAFELLRKDIDFEKNDFSKLLTAQFYLAENLLDTASLLGKNFGKIGKTISGTYENLKKIQSNISLHYEKVQINEEKEISDFLRELSNKKGFIYEENRIIELINALITGVKSNKKEAVLVIDDLDRLDPEHIFRILNVFSCHFDLGNASNNKFGFDKIILVCDIENIRKLFHSKYGLNVDFNGYIDKFYSNEIFCFDNKSILKINLESILSSITVIGDFQSTINFHPSNSFVNELLYILRDLIDSNILSIRTLLRLNEKEIEFEHTEFNFNKPFNNLEIKMLIIFDFLSILFGSQDNLKSALTKLKKMIPYKFYDQIHVDCELLALLDLENYLDLKESYTYTNIDLDLHFDYTINQNQKANSASRLSITKGPYSINIPGKIMINYPFSSLLLLGFEKYLQILNLHSKRIIFSGGEQ